MKPSGEIDPRRTIAPSTTCTVVAFGAGVAVFDAMREETSVLGPLAGWVMSLPGPTTFDGLVFEVVRETDVDESAARSMLAATICELDDAGLIGSTRGSTPIPPTVIGSCRTDHPSTHGVPHRLLERTVVFRCEDEPLLAAIDELTGVVDHAAEPTDFIDVAVRDNGTVIVDANDHWEFPDRQAFFAQLHMVVADFAAAAEHLLCLHAGAVRTPGGEVIVVAGQSGAGKSTLVAALVTAGCDSLGDEHLGVQAETLEAVGCPRPLRLAPSSQSLLGLTGKPRTPIDAVPIHDLRTGAKAVVGAAGPIGRLILVEYGSGETFAIERLEPLAALQSIAPLAFNLGRCPEIALGTLAGIAERVGIERVHHSDVDRVVGHVIR